MQRYATFKQTHSSIYLSSIQYPAASEVSWDEGKLTPRRRIRVVTPKVLRLGLAGFTTGSTPYSVLRTASVQFSQLVARTWAGASWLAGDTRTLIIPGHDECPPIILHKRNTQLRFTIYVDLRSGGDVTGVVNSSHYGGEAGKLGTNLHHAYESESDFKANKSYHDIRSS